MAGADIVIGNLALWAAGSEKRIEAELARHFDASIQYAVVEHPWTDRTGAATGSIEKEMDVSATQMKCTISHFVDYGPALEKAWFFNGKYKILEAARSNNIGHLWARIRKVMSMGAITKGGG